MRVEQSYPSPVFGVSTLAPRNRPQGYATEQVNFRSDPVNKLTRRPSSKYITKVVTPTDVAQVTYHAYERDGSLYQFILDKVSGDITCVVDGVVVDTLALGAYTGPNMEMFSIEHDTYILNKDKVVTLAAGTDASTIRKVSHINVTSALNYAETVQVNITQSNGTRDSITYTVPDLGTTNPDYDSADKARATKQVAIELAARINGGGTHSIDIPNPDYTGDTDICSTPFDYTLETTGPDRYSRLANPDYNPTASECLPYITSYPGITGITAVALGSSVAIYEDTETNWLQVEIESGQGDRTTVAINKVVESTKGLPLYAVVGTRIAIRPDPTTDKGTYYLQAERVSDTATGEILEEVVWSEDRSPDQQFAFNLTTMPHKLTYDGANFTVGTVPFKERQSGDDDSVEVPEFVDNTITTMGYFQKRLVFVSENNVSMTETDDVLNWWKQSAVTLLVSDPVSVASSELETDKLLHLVPHNRDLLVFASNSQFKISGSSAITPQTVSMPLTTKYECQVSAAPVAIGNSVYFPIDYGDSTGFQEYTGEKDTSQDFAAPVTNQVIGYLSGTANLLAASPNLEMIVTTTNTTIGNKLFVYEQYTASGGKRVQQSWSEWVFADEDEVILDVRFRRNALTLLVAKGADLVLKDIEMYTRVTASTEPVFLDDLLVLSTDGLTCTVPTEYDETNAVVVRGVGCSYELFTVDYTRAGDILTFSEDIGAGTVYVGNKYTSSYTPTRPFKYDEDGSTITSDRLRVASFVLTLVKTNQVFMQKTPTYSQTTGPIEFKAQFVNRHPLGTVSTYSGDWAFSYNEDADNATAQFYTDNHLGCTISDIRWKGQYFQTSKRMK